MSLEKRHLVFHPYIGWSLTIISQPRVISHLSAKQAFLPAGEHWEEEEEELTALLQISPAALPAACSLCDVTLTLCRSNPQLDACPVHEALWGNFSPVGGNWPGSASSTWTSHMSVGNHRSSRTRAVSYISTGQVGIVTGAGGKWHLRFWS